MLNPIREQRFPNGIDVETLLLNGREAFVIHKENKAGKPEKFISFSILFVLAGIAAFVFVQQFRYSPAIFQGDRLISPTADRPAPPLTPGLKILASFPQNLVPLSPPEVFEPLNLSDKINGKAGLYLTAGFKSLESQRFKIDENSGGWLEVFIYDMENSENAFSVFSSQKRDDAQPADLGQFSYRSQNALYWVHGPYYIEIIASTASEENMGVMKRFAESFIRNVNVETKSIDERDLFPTGGLDQNRIVLIPDNAFGYEKFDRVYIAGYKIGDAELTAFISRRKTPLQAGQLAAAYHRFLLAFGGEDLEPDPLIANAKVVRILDTYEVIFSQGHYVAGVREAEDLAQAVDLALILKKRLNENAPEK